MPRVLKKHGQKISEQVGIDCQKAIFLVQERICLIITEDLALENIGLGKGDGND